jgi:tetratricopeptide (TPR) repeat protein
LLLVLLGLWPSTPLSAKGQPADELTKEQHDQLKRRAAELKEQARQLDQQANYPQATRLRQEILAIYQQLYPKDRFPHGHPDLATSLNYLGLVLKRQADYAGARAFYQQALAMYQALYPKSGCPRGHPDLATTLNNLGSLLLAQRDYVGAAAYHEQALAMYQALYPKNEYPHGHPALAFTLNKRGRVCAEQGDCAGARAYCQQALEMRQALYPKDQFARGHPDLALSLGNLAILLKEQGDYARARGYNEQALAMYRALYPQERYPRGHSALALSLNNLGTILRELGDYAHARDYLQQALAMYQALYPKEKYPEGHSGVARCLNNLAGVLSAQGDYARARDYAEQALVMRQALYPKEKYPHGHSDLVDSLNRLGQLLHAQGDYAGARGYYQRALAMCQALYPKVKLPHGHPDLAMALHNLGTLLLSQGHYADARGYFEQALAMDQALYPRNLYPHGHPSLAIDRYHLGSVLREQGDYAGARAYCQLALTICRTLYSNDRYPHGHPHLASCLDNLSVLLLSQRDFPAARSCAQEALDMHQGLAEILVPAVSEAEALNHLDTFLWPRDVFLSASHHLADSDAGCYAQVWRSKGALFRILRSRQQALRQLADPESRELWEQMLQTRRDLAQLILSPPRDPAFHRKRLQELTEQKENLERQLAERSAPFRRQQELERSTPTDLARQLPPRSVFIDLLRYVRFEQDPKVAGRKGEKRTPIYVAFVLRPGQVPVRVELGEAGPIDAAVAAWRYDLARRPASLAADTLRRLVGDRLAPHLPADTRTVVLAPDGALTQLPWAALPGSQPGGVLLDDYAFAVVPYGPFLLDRLTAPPTSEPDPSLLLAVGGVHYDQGPRALPEPQPEQLLAWRPAERGRRAPWSAERAAGVVEAAGAGAFQVLPHLLMARPSWSYLPGTLREIEAVRRLAGPCPVQIRQGTQASTAQLLRDLPQARYALLATHGFFADPQLRSVFLLDEAAFRHEGREGRATPGARNPLVLSGLVLAGANRRPAASAEGLSAGDDSILTAEMIASLPLEHLELVVLSACETGLGEVAGGEGVYGLQRAFHMAGAQTTVASLWQVDDKITQELVTRFFDNLWHHGMGRLEALRQAQLAVRRGEGNRAQPRYWAAWVLSGDPGDLNASLAVAPAEGPAAVVVAPWWSAGPWYVTGLGVLGVLILGLVALRRRAAR